MLLLFLAPSARRSNSKLTWLIMLMSEEYTSTSLSFISWLEVHRLNMACWQGINVIFLLLPCDSKYKYISSLRHFHWILESIYTRSLLYLVNQSTQIIVSWITYFPQIFNSSCEIMKYTYICLFHNHGAFDWASFSRLHSRQARRIYHISGILFGGVRKEQVCVPTNIIHCSTWAIWVCSQIK